MIFFLCPDLSLLIVVACHWPKAMLHLSWELQSCCSGCGYWIKSLPRTPWLDFSYSMWTADGSPHPSVSGKTLTLILATAQIHFYCVNYLIASSKKSWITPEVLSSLYPFQWHCSISPVLSNQLLQALPRGLLCCVWLWKWRILAFLR